MTPRQIEAARKRLAKVTDAGALERRDIGANVRITDAAGTVTTGSLVGIRHYIGAGLFGPRAMSSVYLCVDCNGNNCSDGTEFLDPVTVRAWLPGDDTPPLAPYEGGDTDG